MGETRPREHAVHPLWVGLPLGFVLVALLVSVAPPPPAAPAGSPAQEQRAPLQRELWQRVICVAGAEGRPASERGLLESLPSLAHKWNVDLSLVEVDRGLDAVAGLESGRCDGIVVAGRQLVALLPPSATLEAPGGLPSAWSAASMSTSLSRHEPIRRVMVQDDLDLGGIVPSGPLLLWTREGCVTRPAELQGRHIAVDELRTGLGELVEASGGTVHPLDRKSVLRSLRRGELDGVIVDPADAAAHGLWRTLSSSGCTLAHPLAWSTRQLVLQTERFPEELRQAMRARLARAARATDAPQHDVLAGLREGYHYLPDPATAELWDASLLLVQLQMVAAGLLDRTTLVLMERTRCFEDESRVGCGADGLVLPVP